MSAKRPSNLLQSFILGGNGRWFAGSAGLLLTAAIGCGRAPAVDRAATARRSQPVAPEGDATTPIPAYAVPGAHVRSKKGTAVNVNPPGGGIHVNVPPGPQGGGTRVDVGGGGVHVQTPSAGG